MLNCSGFGEVFKGLFRATGKEVALKIMDIESDVDVKSVEEEVKLIKTCDSAHVVKYYGSYFKKDKLWVRIRLALDLPSAPSLASLRSLRLSSVTRDRASMLSGSSGGRSRRSKSAL